MKKQLLIIVVLLCSFLSSQAQSYQKTPQGAAAITQGMNVKVEFYSPSIVRIYKTPKDKPYVRESQVVVKTPEQVSVQYTNKGGNVLMKSAELQVEFNPLTGGVYFYDTHGKLLLKDKDYGTSFAHKDDAGTPAFQVRNAFLLEADEPIYGIGQVWDGKLNRRNSVHQMRNENTLTYSPYFMSPTKGYAVYWDNYSISEFVDAPQELSFSSLGHCADYYFMFGKSPDGVIAEVRELTGKAPMLPLWAYGFFQSKDRYHTQDENLGILRKHRELGVPIDVVIQDWQYWPQYNKTDSAWNAQAFDAQRFPNPRKWVEDIHKLNGKLLIVSWPGFGPKTPQYQELKEKKMLIDFTTWPLNSGTRPYDAYNPEARDIYWKHMNRGLFSYIGNDGWWLDSTEPDHLISSVWHNKDNDFNLPTHLGSYRSVKNLYSFVHNKGIAESQKALTRDKRVVILTRSGFIGQQRFGSNTWSGDVHSTWEMLGKQIPAALNFTMMGIPNWNSDIGGYTGHGYRAVGVEGAKDPRFQELFVRWTQLGAFSPMMRAHGKRIPREIWNFGERGTWCFDAIEKMIKLRYRLLPYIYSTSWDVSKYDGTFMRALVMDFPGDKKTYELGGQYLFGRSVLVVPVTEPSVTEWPVYLPQGADWWDFWTNEKKTGGQTVARTVSKDILPLYIKAGSIFPFGPDVQYSTEKNWDNLEIRIYPGADGTFTLYEDELDNYNYENGVYSTIIFSWDDATRCLTISDREGEFPDMLKNRKFRIVLVKPGSTTGDAPMKGGKTVRYSGKKTVVKL